ncbi:MAG: nitroreductase family deazaflavin-dependent oxidoreductase [Actinomycetota bacterium]
MQGITQRLYQEAFNRFTDLHTAAYRVTRGRVGGTIRGAPIVLVDHLGRKSGKHRTTPLLYLPDGDDVVVIASKGGSHRHPAWWLNLREMDETEIQIGREQRRVKVREASPAERERLWPQVVEMYANYAEYQKRTDREIPLGILSPVG